MLQIYKPVEIVHGLLFSKMILQSTNGSIDPIINAQLPFIFENMNMATGMVCSCK